MKISVEERIVNNFPQKLLNRKYRAIRNKRNRSAVLAGATFGIAAAEAIVHKGFMTILMGSYSLLCMKSAELGTNAMRMLRPQYLEILERAKNINKIRKHINTSV